MKSRNSRPPRTRSFICTRPTMSAIARVALSPGQELRVDGRTIRVEDAVPAGHKIASRRSMRRRASSDTGRSIGRARARIEPGRHVHTHNVAFEELAVRLRISRGVEMPWPKPRARCARRSSAMLREDGRVGTRNYIAVVAASNCAAHTAELIAASYRRRNAASQRRWRGGVSARRRLRARHRSGYGSACSGRWAACWTIPTSRRR